MFYNNVMKTIKLTKMQGCGNDFVIIDYAEYEKTNMPMSELAKKVCDRNFGVGADGMIIPRKIGEQRNRGLEDKLFNNISLSEIPQEQQTDKNLSTFQPFNLSTDKSPHPNPPRPGREQTPNADISWYFYNSDGSTAQMCGNGIRCFAKYVYDKKIIDKKTFSVLTGAGIIKPELLDDGNVRVNMGTPILEDEKIPFKYPPHPTPLPQGEGACADKLSTFNFPLSTDNSLPSYPPTLQSSNTSPSPQPSPQSGEGACADSLSTLQPFNPSTNKVERTIEILDKTFSITPVSMGNPHCVIFTDNDPMEDAKKYGPYIEKHEYFPEKTNTEFVRIKSRNEIDLCVYERGCGITLACGTGACASVVAGVLNNLTEDKVKVNLPGGAVFIDWQGSSANDLKDIYMTGPANYSFVADYML